MATTLFVDGVTLTAAEWFNYVDSISYPLTSVSGTNTITATGPTSLTAYATQQKFRFTPANTNSGATTINIGGLGAKNLYFNGAACAGGEIRANQPCIVIYDGTQFNLIGPFAGGTVAGPVSLSSTLSVAGGIDVNSTKFNVNATTGNVTATGYFRAMSGTGVPAGGAADQGLEMFSSGIGVFAGSGAPSLSAPKGSLYLRTDGNTTNNRAYIATDAVGGWTALTTAG